MSDRCKKIEPSTEIDRMLYKYGTSEYRKGYVEIGDEKIVMPINYKNIADDIENFEVRDTDIWMITYPKTGSTWTQEMIWMIINDLDFEGAKVNIEERFIFLELQCIFDFDEILDKFPEHMSASFLVKSLNMAKNDTRTPRLIKTHLPWCLLPKAIREGTTQAKIVHVMRNPKDTCVSFYHHQRLIDGFSGSFEEFCELFLAGRLYYGLYWNILHFWKRRHDPNILLIKYEDMKRDLRTVIKKVSDFLIGKQLSEDQTDALVDHLSFDKMKNNPSVNYEDNLKKKETFLKSVGTNGKFMRSGVIGSYKFELTPEMEEKFDNWTKEHTENLNITF